MNVMYCLCIHDNSREVIKNSFSYQEDQINILLLLVVTCATQVLDMHMTFELF